MVFYFIKSTPNLFEIDKYKFLWNLFQFSKKFTNIFLNFINLKFINIEFLKNYIFSHKYNYIDV
jgi:hypothetical protein